MTKWLQRQRFRWLTDSQRVTWTAFAILAMFFERNSSYRGALNCVCFGDCSNLLSIFRANYNNNLDKTNGTVKTLLSPRKPIINEELSGVNLWRGQTLRKILKSIFLWNFCTFYSNWSLSTMVKLAFICRNELLINSNFLKKCKKSFYIICQCTICT